jgi:UDP-N-acetylmuramate dehydrogenase
MLQIRDNVPLAPLTTFGIGGDAMHFVDVQTEADLREAVSLAKEKGVPFVVLAGGSNVLVPDGGLDALVAHIVPGEHRFEGKRLAADAGCNLLALIREAAGLGLGGWEKLAGIPGSIGGAIRGNAGAFGTEITDVATRVSAFNSVTGDSRDFTNGDCDFSYRHSFFKDNPEWIITKVALELHEVTPDESARLIEETIQERERRHLQNVRAAGSFFMNPVAPTGIVEMFESEKGVKARESRVPAGWLIEKAGLKGHRVGDAIASEQHPNYLVNAGEASAHDVGNLAQLIKLEVFAQFGVELQEEAALL